MCVKTCTFGTRKVHKNIPIDSLYHMIHIYLFIYLFNTYDTYINNILYLKINIFF